MKSKSILLLLSFFSALCFAGCGDDSSDGDKENKKVSIGAKCNYETDEAYYCAEGKIVTCDNTNHYVVDTDCAEKYGAKYTCAIFGTTTPSCLSEEAQCNDVGALKTECDSDIYFGTSIYSYQCKAANDGKKFWVLDQNDLCDDGFGYCNADNSCHSRESCEYQVTEDSCVSNYIKSCDEENYVTAFNCASLGNQYQCLKIDQRFDCYSDAEKCTEADASKQSVKTICKVGDDNLYSYTCKKADNNNYYWTKVSRQSCLGKCDASGVDCDASGVYDPDEDYEE